MNEIRRPVREADEIAAIRGIVERHALPDFMTGFTLRLGTFNDDPAVWVTFHVTDDLPQDSDEADPRLQAAETTIRDIRDDLFVQYPERYPFFSFVIA